MDKTEAKEKIAELISKYKELSSKEIKGYNEANTKQFFILPLFAALGWNVDDCNEMSLEENAPNGRVDFAFKINGVSRLYVEAKKLGADLNNPDFIKQANSYALNRSIQWAILTNFTDIKLLNPQRSQPFINLSYNDYIESFDKLWLLSKESFVDDTLNKEAAQYGIIPNPIPIEERLFKLLRHWREELYNQILHHNEEWLKQEQIDEIIEKLFNRLIFIRTAEDRNLEEKKLHSAVYIWKNHGSKNGELRSSLKDIFEYYQGYYDSELFETHLLDDDRLSIYESTLADILYGLYDIPGGIASYNFAVIDADVLGRVYEQYLGYVSKHIVEKARQAQIRMSFGGAIDTDYKLVEKKQRRKEQGIYYTPKFVTDYIVKETVGRFLQEHSYNENLNIKILDPACGSGSFLIRAYDELLRYHASVRSKITTEMDSIARMPILTGNIFGVDLDQQAVEIARLNLLLRGLAKRDHLPPLTDNIKRGNSLISGTDEELKGYFGDNWRDKHPFNWEYEFKDIMANGGFDVVIGNPPWVSISGKHKSLALSAQEFQYLFDNYAMNSYAPNLYEIFILRSLDLLRENGYFSFIVPDRFVANKQFISLREKILKQFTVEKLLFRYPFPGIIADTIIFVIRKTKAAKSHSMNIIDFPSKETVKVMQYSFLNTEDFVFSFIDPKIDIIFKKIQKSKNVKPLSDLVKMTSGCGAKSDLLHTGKKLKGELKVIKGENVNRYSIEGFFWFEFIDDNLSGRTRDTNKLGSKEKVLLRKTGADIIAAFDESGIFPEQSLYFLYGLDKPRLLYLLGILNSKIINAYYRNFAITNRNTTPQLKNIDLDKFPIVAPQKEENHTVKLISLVEKMLELNKKLAPIRGSYSNEHDELVKEIEKTDREID
ncbi:MAG: TaqI-like C-terminal specificity domain-containing protein, partial [Syntrophorhabdaceae bacterium]